MIRLTSVAVKAISRRGRLAGHLKVIRYTNASLTARALKQIELPIALLKLEHRLFAIIEAGLAKPWSFFYRLSRIAADIRKSARSYLFKRVALSLSKAVFQFLDPVDHLRDLVLQHEYRVLGQIERLLHRKHLIVNRSNRLRLRALTAQHLEESNYLTRFC